MFDRKSTKKPIEHVKKHLKLTLHGTLELKDEAYIQVLKQIKDNPDIENTKRGWSFLSILACSFTPSPALFYSILNYLLYEIKNNDETYIVRRANYIFVRLVRTYEHKRHYIISDNEMVHIEVS